MRNAVIFSIACYNCHKGKGYSMDELKILTYLHENYFPRDLTFRFAGSGGQQAMRDLKEPKNIPGFKPPLYYQCDGFSRKTYNYDRETKTLTVTGDKKGTVFEVLGVTITAIHYFIRQMNYPHVKVFVNMDMGL